MEDSGPYGFVGFQNSDRMPDLVDRADLPQVHKTIDRPEHSVSQEERVWA
jgi:hypothetical protein